MEYQKEIEQHKNQGCMVPHFSPPYDLDQILNPATPPSPSFSGSGPSISPCPSPAPSVSPGPPPRVPRQACRAEQTPSVQVYDGSEVLNAGGGRTEEMSRAMAPGMMTTVGMVAPVPTTVTTLAPVEIAELKQEPKQVHYLKVRNKDGSIKTLCLDQEDYLRVVQTVKAKRAAATQQNLMTQRTQPPPETVTSASQPQQMPFMPQMKPELQISMNAGVLQPHVELVHEESQNTGQKLDTFDDLISVLKNTVEDPKRQFELIPVNPNEVLVKQEPVDAEYEQHSFTPMKAEPTMTRVKQEVVDLTHTMGNNPSDSSGQWASTGQQIRAGLDVLANQNDSPLTSNTHIQNLIQFLEKDDSTYTVTVTDPKTAQVLEQATAKPSSVQPPRQPAGQRTAADFTTTLGQHRTYITSSAAVGSLSISKVDSSSSQVSQSSGQSVLIKPVMTMQKKVDAGPRHQPQSVSVSAMQNVKLRVRPHTAQLVAPTLGLPGGKGQVTGQHNNAMAFKKLAKLTNASWNGNSAKTSQDVTESLMQTTPTSVSTTSAMAPMQQQVIMVSGSDTLLSTSTSQIMEYLQANSIESLGSWKVISDF